MSEAVRQLEPRTLWGRFADLNEIPRASGKEEAVCAWITGLAREAGLEVESDPVGNVLVRKPATPGMENRKTVILQSHVDMVHQKNNDTDFDFDTEGIRMVVEGDWVKAEGTTLGADNGLGVATMLAVMESTDLPHPPLEFLFTIDEETGMTGALELQQEWLRGDILLNLDTEDDREIGIGCAGGVDLSFRGTYAPIAGTEDHGVVVEVKGGSGGHSGMDIHKGLANANKLLVRVLQEMGAREPHTELAALDGGGLRNAIPRGQGDAVLQLPCGGLGGGSRRIDRLHPSRIPDHGPRPCHPFPRGGRPGPGGAGGAGRLAAGRPRRLSERD